MKKLLTIIIPTYNRINFLIRLLRYYEIYSFPVKILILDSSSNPEFNKLIKLYIKLENIRLIKFHYNIHMMNKIKEGLKHVNTPYYVFCADDDFLSIPSLTEMVSFLENNNDYYSVQGRTLLFKKLDNDSLRISEMNFYFRDKDINSDILQDRITSYFSFYKPVFYAVHRNNYPEYLLTNKQFKGISSYRYGSLSELSLAFTSMILGKHKVLPVLYSIREHIENSSGRQAIPIEKLAYDERHEKVYNYYINFLARFISLINNKNFNDSKEIIQKGMDTYINDFCKKYFGKKIKSSVVIDDKNVDASSIFNTQVAMNEWQKIKKIINS